MYYPKRKVHSHVLGDHNGPQGRHNHPSGLSAYLFRDSMENIYKATWVSLQRQFAKEQKVSWVDL